VLIRTWKHSNFGEEEKDSTPLLLSGGSRVGSIRSTTRASSAGSGSAQSRAVGGVDTNGDVANDTVGNVNAVGSDDVNDGVVAVGEALGVDRVDVVGGAVDLGVADVGLKGHQGLGDGLVEVELVDGVGVAGNNGTVGV
jgi:hypothetical protein